MTYNHHDKAGNQGDCVKHPALVAALDVIINGQTSLFHYLDLFAGQARHQIPKKMNDGQKNGIGKLASISDTDETPKSFACWRNMWKPENSIQFLTLDYPGSSLIAYHRVKCAARNIKLELYDHSSEVQNNLKDEFASSGRIDGLGNDSCEIRHSLALTQLSSEAANQADFVFIDPPGWHSTAKENADYPDWHQVCERILSPRIQANRATLMWMPTSGNSKAFDGTPKDRLLEARQLGYEWSAVRWKSHGSGTGCVLVYNCAKSAIREAVDYIVDVMGDKWFKRHSSG